MVVGGTHLRYPSRLLTALKPIDLSFGGAIELAIVNLINCSLNTPKLSNHVQTDGVKIASQIDDRFIESLVVINFFRLVLKAIYAEKPVVPRRR